MDYDYDKPQFVWLHGNLNAAFVQALAASVHFDHRLRAGHFFWTTAWRIISLRFKMFIVQHLSFPCSTHPQCRDVVGVIIPFLDEYNNLKPPTIK